jgi:predicted enzyme related to lactoylglutathione lyase
VRSDAEHWTVTDIHATVEALTAAGATLQGSISDVGGGKLIATLTNPDGNPIVLMQQPA